MKRFNVDFYQRLFDSMDTNAVMMQVEEDGSYYPIWCSEEFTEMMEGTAEDFIRLESGGTMSTIHPEDREEVAYLFRHHVTKAGTNNLNVRKCTVKGNWIWVNIHYAFVQEDGVQYAYCTYFDVTDIKKNEIQLENMYEGMRQELVKFSDETLATVRVDLTLDKIEVTLGRDLYDSDSNALTFSEAIQARADYLPIESERNKFLQMFRIDNLMQAYEEGHNLVSEVMYSRRQNGRQSFVNYTATLMRQPVTGHAIAFITEKEYNSEKVNETLFQKVLAEQYDMITYLVDGQYGVVIGDADRIEKGSIFPKKRNGSYGTYIKTQVAPVISGTEEERERLLDALSLDRIAKQLSEREPYEVNLACEMDGEIFNKRFVFYLVDKEAKFYILLKSDTTDLMKEQRERNEQLKTALEEANQANVAKTAFLSSMSHEIRTPMNAIIGLDNIALKEKNLPSNIKEYLEKIGGSARHLLNLINDILDMSRIESGRMVLKNEEFSFGNMLEQINTMINSQCQDRGLHYDCVINGKVDEYYIGDDMKLKQVLINILGNAVKFTPVGGKVSFTVERTAQFEDHSTLCFVIKDTGIGMDAEYIPKIFEAFSQEDGAKTNAYGGTGLGMAITKNIVEMMNGDISVTSEKGVGSEFVVNVTLKNCDKVGNQENGIRLQDMKVLVIDDDPIACEHAVLVLEEIGIAADSSLNGEEAVEMIRLRHARREEYNLILVDLKMPEQDGIEVTRKIREMIGNESAIIILTAYSWDDVMEEALDAGVDGFMSKPIFVSGVMEEFRAVIQKKKIGLPAQEHRAELSGRRILLAEDVLINAEIMKQLLNMREMEVDHAENGQIVVDMFANSKENYYDAILMDVRMPVMDGLEATAAIRLLERPDAKTVPIIAMTANAFDEDVQHSLQAGMNAHLSKPVEPEHLYETLEMLIY